MLVLSRKPDQTIVIAGDIIVRVLKVEGKQVRIGITAPDNIRIMRGELPPHKPDDDSAEKALFG